MKTDHHAVVVGIGTYPGFTDLDGPSADAAAFHDWLIDPAKGDVDPANVHLLRTDDFHPPAPDTVYDAHPWDDEVRRLLRPFVSDGMAQAWVGTRLYIYMAGHGFSVADPARASLTALYAANAGIDEAPNVVGTIYAEWFRLNAVFREIVLIMDCCRTVDVLHGLDERAMPEVQGRAGLVTQVKKFYACAAQWGQVARERRMNGAVKGIFTTTLLEALERARPNRLGHVTGTILKGYIHQNIDTVAGDARVEQPDIDADDQRDIVFAERHEVPEPKIFFHLDPFASEDHLRNRAAGHARNGLSSAASSWSVSWALRGAPKTAPSRSKITESAIRI